MIKTLEVHTDERGDLFEMLRADEIEKQIKQINIIKVNPGFERGDHYHEKKFEWFTVVQGSVELTLYNVKTKEKQIIELSDKKPQMISIVPNVHHKFKNNSNEIAVLVEAIDHTYNPQEEDTFPLEIT